MTMSEIWNTLTVIICSLFGGCQDEANCRLLVWQKVTHTICSYDTSKVDMRLFLKDASGKPYRRLDNLEKALPDKPVMLMNGGMYHTDLDAVGLYVEDRKEHQKVSTKGGWGNFHLLPNGVFWGKGGKFSVTETKTFIKQNPKPDFATQSGPMLVINGKLHPRFLKNSDSRKIRNGVGVSKDGKRLHFAISHQGISFWNFGTLFSDELKTHNALFLDGTVSALRSDGFTQGGWRSLGPMIAVFKK